MISDSVKWSAMGSEIILRIPFILTVRTSETALFTYFCFLLKRSVLEKNLKLLMECVDDLSQDANKFFNYQRQHAKQQHAKQQVLAKRVCVYCIIYML